MLHKKIGSIFLILALFSFFYNLLFNPTPQSIPNLMEDSVVALLLCVSIVSNSKWAMALQLVIMFAVAFITLGAEDSRLFGAIITAVAFILVYAYSGYTRLPPMATVVMSLVCIVFTIIAVAQFKIPTQDEFVKSVTWALFMHVFVAAIYFIIEDVSRNFAKSRVRSAEIENARLRSLNYEITTKQGPNYGLGGMRIENH